MTRRQRAVWIGAVVVAVAALALLLGGRSGPSSVAAGESGAGGDGGGGVANGSVSSSGVRPLPAQRVSGAPDARPAAPATGTAVASAPAGTPGVRIVERGDLALTVAARSVGATVQRLTALASVAGGYVQDSSTAGSSTAPSGAVTLRVPVNRFADTVARARTLGTVESLTTSTADVTGRYVDLVARRNALQRTRATYLGILSGAHTIGATLSVQQRIDDVQSQIEQLQGQLKLLRGQTSDATLTVSVEPPTKLLPTGGSRTGIGAAWHRSWERFARGVDAIVAALGPLVLALLIVLVVTVTGRLGYRGVRRRLG